jgi:ElaA protein
MSGLMIEDRAFAELTTQQFHDLVKLRVDVFVVEQDCAYPELDGRDAEPSTRHVWVPDADAGPRAYLRLVDDGGQRRIGRVAVRPADRSIGLARALLGYVLDTHRGPWVLDAQTHLREWYEGLGFQVAGSEFVEDGIAHVPMRLESRR